MSKEHRVPSKVFRYNFSIGNCGRPLFGESFAKISESL